MRILLIPLDYHRHQEEPRLFTDLLNGFNSLWNAMLYDGDEAKAEAFQPDFVWYQGSLNNPSEFKQKVGGKWIMWTGDCRYTPIQSLMDMRHVIDVYHLPYFGQLLNQHSQLLGNPCRFIFEPIHQWRFRTYKQSGNDIVFIGNHYDSLEGAEARDYLKGFIKKHVSELKLYGSISGDMVCNYDVPDIYNNAFAVIACNNHKNIDGYFTPRNTAAMAASTCVLMEYFPGIETFFKSWENCVIFHNKYELLDQIRFLQNNPEIRNEIAKKAAFYASEYNYTRFAEQTIRLCK